MKYIILVCTVLLAAVPSLGQVSLYAFAQGDSARIVVFVEMNTFCEEPEGHTIVVEEELVGNCESPTTVSPTPFPMPAYNTQGGFEFVVALPDPLRYFKYTAVGVDPSGERYSFNLGDVARAYDFYGLENAVVARGYIGWNGWHYDFEPCADSCWTATGPGCPLAFEEAEAGWEDFVDSGQLVNLYGRAHVDGMPGAHCVIVSHVEAEYDAAGCAAVASERDSWDSVKARFR